MYITWDFNSMIVLSETSGYLPSVFYLEFNAKVNSPGSLRNYVEVNGTESCCGRWGYSNASACVYVSKGNLLCEKKVFCSKTQQWVEEINANVGATARFRITMTYQGSGTLTSIKVKDVLPVCLQYADAANPVQTAVSGKNVYWNLSSTLTNGQSTSIEFNALVISTGTNINVANITALENGVTPLYCQDTATVIAQQPGNIVCDKKVWNPTTQQWVEQINSIIGDTVRFRITMTYQGSGTLTSIKVKDVLPVCLQYADAANPVQTAVSGKNVYWNLSSTLTNGQSTSIEFNALVISTGTNINLANITASESGCITQLYCQDTATVIVQQPDQFICEKKVWNPTTQQWVEQINSIIGDTVRFRITMTYQGSGTLTSIKVKDVLPVCLQYADNANPVQTAVSGKNVYWNLSTTLTNGQSTSIEFDAFVISVGTNVNLVNITGSKDSGLPLYCQDTATVIVGECPSPSPSLTCEKKVWNPTTQQWVEQINANIGNTVRFRVTMTYNGSGTLMNIKVKDVLPVCLQYADNANPVQTAVSGKNVYWNLSTTLTNGQSTSIQFDALVISAGTNVNLVNITGSENCVLPLYCQDTATVIVTQPPSLTCEKKVKDPQTQQWVEQINANIGNTVRFRITMTYSRIR